MQKVKKPFSFSNPTIAVVVATRARPREVGRLIYRLDRQTLPPRHVIVIGVEEGDLPCHLLNDQLQHTKFRSLLSSAGLCKQRNTGVDAVIDECDFIIFFDDDFVPSKFAIEAIVRTFEENPEVVGLTGTCLADGVTIGGIVDDVADKLVDNFDRQYPYMFEKGPSHLFDLTKWGLYGCNMAFRASAIGSDRFDENLPLYGWLEDVDFSVRIATNGALKRSSSFAGVHQGVTHGRSPGQRLGYSQVVNPLYLRQKGIFGYRRALVRIFRNIAANHYRSIFGAEDWIDRRGRMIGNWKAFLDVICGRVDPTRILKIDNKHGLG